ncbi:MAG TPA: hypothetical protein VL651_17405, partial [Bacteroidia bacterium]|nr:hypothetical protein [Bacteroidia bacterium]
GKRHFSVSSNTSLGAHGGFMFRDGKNSLAYTQLDLEFQQNKACYSFIAPFIWTTVHDSFAGWVMTDKYLKAGLAVEQNFFKGNSSFMGGDSYFFIREGLGYTFFHRNFDQLIKQDHYEDWTSHGKGMTATTIMAHTTSVMLTSEIGLKAFNYDHTRSLDYGVAFYAPFSRTYTDQYEFFQQNVSTGKSNVTYNGSTIMLNLRYNFGVPIKEHVHPIDSTKNKQPDLLANQVNQRTMEVQSTVTTSRKKIKVKVWDRDEIDGDSITLTLNGEIVKEHISLRRHKKTYTLKLDSGDNYLVMYAENLGTVPPNTAAVIIKEGFKKRRLALQSDIGKSGAVKIVNTN